MYESMKSSIDYGGIWLKNRIFFAPTTLGLPWEEYLVKLRKIAAGGCSLVIIGDIPVSLHAVEPTMYTQEGITHYRTLVDLVHSCDCKISAQLYLSDSNADISPEKTSEGSFLLPLKNDDIGPWLSGLPKEKLRSMALAFSEAADVALEIGFDMIQVLGDRLLGSMCSTVFNSRTDYYGGSPENRAHFVCECVQAIRKKHPDLPIDYKLTVRQDYPHYGNAGVLAEELPVFVPMLEDAGVTSFHVSLANHSFLQDVIPGRAHPYFGQEGCFLKFCDEVRKFTDKPVCGVGSLSSPDYIEAQIESGRIDCAAMSRQLIADPEWMNKVCCGDASSIRQCVRCNTTCINGMLNRSGVHCFQEE